MTHKKHIAAYLKGTAVLLLLIPLHELVHAGTCLGLGGTVLDLQLFSYTVCGGSVEAMPLYNTLNGLNQSATSFLLLLQFGRVHTFNVALPLLSRLL